MPDREPTAALGRRTVLGWTVALSAAALTGCGNGDTDPDPGPSARAYCVPSASLAVRRTLAGAPLVYEVTGRRSGFRFDDDFHGQLGDWGADLAATWRSEPDRIRTYGSWTDGGTRCDSWHHAGRAFDLAAVRFADGRTVSCRYDRWRDEPAAALADRLRDYWRLAAGLHARFAYVLSYLYNADHANHLHIDNGRSGTSAPVFSARSRVQVQAAQAVARYLWDVPTELSGRWDAASRSALRTALDRAGIDGDLDDRGNWVAFMTVSARHPPGS